MSCDLCPDCKDADDKLKSGRYSTAIAPCPHKEEMVECRFCKGYGKRMKDALYGDLSYFEYAKCPDCSGTGKVKKG